jgi:glutamate carboxypeptidase
MDQLIPYLEAREQTYLGRLRRLVDTNSGLDNPEGRLACLEQLERVYKGLGFATERIARPGDMVHLVARRPGADTAAKILLLGHFDTVYDSTSGFVSFQEEGPVLTGPGVGDMKGGLVVIQAMLDAMQFVGGLDRYDWLVFHNADEEIQSPTSRDLIEQFAADRDLCLDFEIGRKTGAVVRSRAGVGRYFVTVHGKAAHAGMNHGAGVNAIVGLAHLITAFAGLSDPALGTTLNVGVVRGGTKRNVVPDVASCELDVRVTSLAEGARIDAAIRALCATAPVPGSRVDIVGGIGRPPWQRNAACDKLIGHFLDTAKRYDIKLSAEDTGGGSDANFTAALGIATIDGLGPVGEHPHTFEERIQRHSVIERAKLCALALLTWTRDSDELPS